MSRNGVLFSTKDRYDYPYWKTLVWTIVPGVILEFAVWIFFRGEFMMLMGCLLGLFLGKELVDPLLMKKSYVEIHTTYIQGVSMEKLGGKGVIFTINYTDIIRVHAVPHQVIVHTLYGKYKAQAYKCEKEVKEMILRRMP